MSRHKKRQANLPQKTPTPGEISGLYNPKPQKDQQLEKPFKMISQRWSAPLPPPDELKKYDIIIPGMAERLLIQFEKQSNHRIEMEKEVIISRSANMKRGQVFAFIIALAFLCGSLYCGIIGQPKLGGILGGTTIVGLVSAFCYGSYLQKEERRQKNKGMETDKD